METVVDRLANKLRFCRNFVSGKINEAPTVLR